MEFLVKRFCKVSKILYIHAQPEGLGVLFFYQKIQNFLEFCPYLPFSPSFPPSINVFVSGCPYRERRGPTGGVGDTRLADWLTPLTYRPPLLLLVVGLLFTWNGGSFLGGPPAGRPPKQMVGGERNWFSLAPRSLALSALLLPCFAGLFFILSSPGCPNMVITTVSWTVCCLTVARKLFYSVNVVQKFFVPNYGSKTFRLSNCGAVKIHGCLTVPNFPHFLSTDHNFFRFQLFLHAGPPQCRSRCGSPRRRIRYPSTWYASRMARSRRILSASATGRCFFVMK